MNKVLFLTHVDAPGGAEFKMIRLCEALGERAEVVHFQPGPLETLLADKRIVASVITMPDRMAGFRREQGFAAAAGAVPATASMIRKVAAKCAGYGTVVCMSQKSFLLAALGKPLHRRPIVWFMNDILSRDHFSRSLIFLLTRIFRYSPDHVVLNSQASLLAWQEAGGRKKNVHLIYPGSDVAAFDEALRDRKTIESHRKSFSPDGKPLIGIFGRISPWKGQDVFLKALARIEGARGVIVGGALFGEEEYETKLKTLARDLGVEDRVTFAGHRDDIPKIMAACDIVAHCSTSPEPFGLVIVEAMLCKTPVIASDAGGAREIVISGETGYLTAPGDDTALAKAIAAILNNRKNAQELAQKARVRANGNFSNAAMVEQFRYVLG
ncbi:MAG: glycosyltransferase family 1 protein [Alphaproteobacteria bacterium]|nr:glycosyltransferase family 1 protein [Alphaproteobacteria bacterium]